MTRQYTIKYIRWLKFVMPLRYVFPKQKGRIISITYMESSMSQGSIVRAHTHTHMWKEIQYFFTTAYIWVPYANAKIKIKMYGYTKATCFESCVTMQIRWVTYPSLWSTSWKELEK